MRLDYYNHSTELPGTGKCLTYNFLTGLLVCHSAGKEPTFDNHEISIEEIREHYFKNCRESNALYLIITPTMDCNFDCPYCFESHRKGRMSDDTQSQLIKWVAMMLDSHEYTLLDIKWFGGEPLLGIDIIERLTQGFEELIAGRDIEIRARVLSNAYLLDQKMVDRLEACHVTSIMTTVDGIGEYNDRTRRLRNGDGSFATIEKNLLSIRTSMNIAVRTNLHKDNLEQRHKLAKWVDMLANKTGNSVEACLSFVNIGSPVFDKDASVDVLTTAEFVEILSEDNWKYLIENPKIRSQYACASSSLNAYTIDEKGNIYKCEDSVGKPEYIVGNLWEGVDSSKLNFYEKGFPEDAECLECKFLPQCYGGCPNARLNYNHKICDLAKYDTDSYVLGKFRNYTADHFTPSEFNRIEKIIKENNLDYWVIMYYLRFKFSPDYNGGIIISNTDFLPQLCKGNNTYMLHEEFIERMLHFEKLGRVDFILRDKVEPFRRMPELMGRDYLDLSQATQADLNAWAGRNPRFVAKANKMGGRGFAVYTCDAVPTIEDLREADTSILESYIVQHEELNKIFPGSVCSIRIDTLNIDGEISFPLNHVLIVGEGDSIDDGKQLKSLYRIMLNEEGQILEALHFDEVRGAVRATRHADTGYEFTRGKKIPLISEARRLCAEAAAHFPENALTAWDVALTPSGPIIIEGNSISGAMDNYQVLNYYYQGRGCRQELEAILNKL